jgi:hypothetical protein
MDVAGRATQDAKAEGWGEGTLKKHPHPNLLPEGEGTVSLYSITSLAN